MDAECGSWEGLRREMTVLPEGQAFGQWPGGYVGASKMIREDARRERGTRIGGEELEKAGKIVAKVVDVTSMRCREVEDVEQVAAGETAEWTAREAGNVEIWTAVAGCRKRRPEGVRREGDEEVVEGVVKCR